MARGDLAALRAAVKKRPEVLLERDPEQRTLLLNACLPIFRIANVDVIAALLQLGADARDVDFRGCSSLHGIVQMDTAKYPQPTDEVARLLVGKGLPVDQQDRFGNSALWRAVFDWRPGARFLAVDCLLQLGANLDLKNYHGSSPRDVLENDGKDELKKHLAAFPR